MGSTKYTRAIVVAVKKLSGRLKRLPLYQQFLVVSAVVFMVVIAGNVVSLMTPRNAVLSYREPTCVSSFVPFPAFFSANSEDVDVFSERTITFGNRSPVFARSLCVEPKRAPLPGEPLKATVSLRALPLLGQRIKIDVPDYPSPLPLAYEKAVIELSVRDDLIVALNDEDKIFDYTIRANGSNHICNKDDILLRCNLERLSLQQASEYPVVVDRIFKDETVETIAQKTLVTLDPLEVTSSSIAEGKTVFEEIQAITIDFNKELQEPDKTQILLNDSNGMLADFALSITDEQLTLQLNEPLARKMDYSLIITTDVLAKDNASLQQRWELNFTISGGPEVASSNIQPSGFPRQSAITVVFDQQLDDRQSLEEIVRVSLGESAVATFITIDGAVLRITSQGNLPLCGQFLVQISGEIASKYGVINEVDWQESGRTTCKTTSIIGNSVSGRPIYAHTFGSGPNTILYVGGMHGSEYSSVIVLEEWLKELDANPQRIPSDKKLIVIPESCPDCVVARSRLNANRVDLNRNFPTNDWQSEVYIPGPTHLPEGGGNRALSEPEAKALADVVRRERPMLTLTYHAVADIVISNDAGRSIEWGREYARLSGYGFSTTNDIENVFNYTATGAFEDWIHDELALPALLVELGTMASNEINRNRSALWYTVNL